MLVKGISAGLWIQPGSSCLATLQTGGVCRANGCLCALTRPVQSVILPISLATEYSCWSFLAVLRCLCRERRAVNTLCDHAGLSCLRTHAGKRGRSINMRLCGTAPFTTDFFNGLLTARVVTIIGPTLSGPTLSKTSLNSNWRSSSKAFPLARSARSVLRFTSWNIPGCGARARMLPISRRICCLHRRKFNVPLR